MNMACLLICLSSAHSFYLSFSSIIIILLIIWKLHMMIFDHTCFPLLPGLPLHHIPPPPKKKKGKKKIHQVQFVFPVYSLDIVRLSVANPLKETSFLIPQPQLQKPSAVKSYISASLLQFLGALINALLSRLFL